MSWNLPKTESIVTVQRRFRTIYRTEPPTDKTIREWYIEIPAECLPVRCETKRPVEAIGRDCRACARNVCQEPSEVNKSARAGNYRCRTETWSVSLFVVMLSFGVTIPATVPQGSEIPEGLMNNAVYIGCTRLNDKLFL